LPQLDPFVAAGLRFEGYFQICALLVDPFSNGVKFMRYFMILLASAATIAVPSLGAAADYTTAKKLCTDAFGRRGPCPATVYAGRSVGETAEDIQPLLIGGGLLAAGGVAAGALIASPRSGLGGVVFLGSPASASP
jgi:hypothetical protein